MSIRRAILFERRRRRVCNNFSFSKLVTENWGAMIELGPNDSDMKKTCTYVIKRHAIGNLQGVPKSDFQNAAGAMVHLY